MTNAWEKKGETRIGSEEERKRTVSTHKPTTKVAYIPLIEHNQEPTTKAEGMRKHKEGWDEVGRAVDNIFDRARS